jgi:hypothetical protein
VAPNAFAVNPAKEDARKLRRFRSNCETLKLMAIHLVDGLQKE